MREKEKIKLMLSVRDKHIMALTTIMETCGKVVMDSLQESIKHKKDPETKKYLEKLYWNAKMEWHKWYNANEVLMNNVDKKDREIITDKSFKLWKALN